MSANEQFVLNHIRQINLFNNLPESQLVAIARIAQIVRFEPGNLILREGVPLPGLYYFVSGRGVLTRSVSNPQSAEIPFQQSEPVEQPVGAVGGGDIIGDGALFQELFAPNSLRITEPSIVIFISRKQMLSLLAQQTEIRATIGGMQSAPPQTIAQTSSPPARRSTATGEMPALPRTARPAFRGQRPDENILHISRRHWWAFGRHFWLLALIAAVFIGLAILAGGLIPALTLVFGALALIVPGAVLYVMYLEWYDDVVVVTDQRVVRVFNNILNIENSISEIPLDSVDEISIEIPPADPFARIFGYETLEIKTPGQGGNQTLDMMPDGDVIRKLVFEHRDQYRQQLESQHRQILQAEVERLVGQDERQPAVTSGTQPASPLIANSQVKPTQFSLLAPARMSYIDAEGRLVFRKHWFVWLQHVFVPGLVLFVGIVLLVMNLTTVFGAARGVLTIVGWLATLGGALWTYLADWDWRNDIFIISGDTVTFIRKRPLLLQNQRDDVRLERVNNVTSEIKGIFGSLFNMGDVHLNLIGSEAADRKTFDSVKDPQEIQAYLSQQQQAVRRRLQENEARQQRDSIAEVLGVYHETVSGGQAPPYPPQADPRFGQGQNYPPQQPPQRRQQNLYPPDLTQPSGAPPQPRQPSPYNPNVNQPQRPSPSQGQNPGAGSRPPGVPRRRHDDEQ